MACSSGGWSRHPPLNRGGQPKQSLRDRWSTGEHEAPPARPPAGMPDDDHRCHGNRDSSLQFRALTPGCLCFGSVGSVWSVRIYVKAARWQASLDRATACAGFAALFGQPSSDDRVGVDWWGRRRVVARHWGRSIPRATNRHRACENAAGCRAGYREARNRRSNGGCIWSAGQAR